MRGCAEPIAETRGVPGLPDGIECCATSLEACTGAAVLAVGKFINAIIKFVIVAMAIFWLLKVLTKLRVREEAKEKGPTPTEALLAEIRDLLKAR